MSQKIKITPLMDLEAEVSVMNDRNASVALVHLWDNGTGAVLAHATGASKREQGDIYNESVAVKLAVGRALQKMSRQMISEANKEVKAAMAEAEEKAARKLEEQAKAADDALADLLAFLGVVPDATMPPLSFGFDGKDEFSNPLADLARMADEYASATDTGHDESVTADGTPVSSLPESLRATLAALGFYPHQVQIVDLDKLEAESGFGSADYADQRPGL